MQVSTAALPALRLPVAEKRHWPTALMLATAVALYIIAGLSLAMLESSHGTAYAKIPGGRAAIPGLGVPPQPEPMRFREIAPQDALAINAAVPVSDLPNPAASPLAISFA